MFCSALRLVFSIPDAQYQGYDLREVVFLVVPYPKLPILVTTTSPDLNNCTISTRRVHSGPHARLCKSSIWQISVRVSQNVRSSNINVIDRNIQPTTHVASFDSLCEVQPEKPSVEKAPHLGHRLQVSSKACICLIPPPYPPPGFLSHSPSRSRAQHHVQGASSATTTTSPTPTPISPVNSCSPHPLCDTVRKKLVSIWDDWCLRVVKMGGLRRELSRHKRLASMGCGSRGQEFGNSSFRIFYVPRHHRTTPLTTHPQRQHPSTLPPTLLVPKSASSALTIQTSHIPSVPAQNSQSRYDGMAAVQDQYHAQLDFTYCVFEW
ncbi:hypothetical protein CVT24_012257 [Panaeolus cyanescens]|uniref:Uncharacterized protein n=1 Tax=Panaeolus cyanescens TaxID=181874 RepID=A0A409WDY7_9AGAR|nr:hypothetical protein CVT24_012257 [Panaeolus cyanescens]